MTTAGQALTGRASRISIPRVLTAGAFAGGIALGLLAGRGLAGGQPVSPRSATVAAAPQQAQIVGLAVYRTTEMSLTAALARGDAPAAAHFRSQLDQLRTPAIVSALAHERVDVELGLAAAKAWNDPRMAAEFRNRLATQGR